MLNLERLKDSRLELMVIINDMFCCHCQGNCKEDSKLSYVNAIFRIYNDVNDTLSAKDFIELEEKVLISILQSINKLSENNRIEPLFESSFYNFINHSIYVMMVQKYDMNKIK